MPDENEELVRFRVMVPKKNVDRKTGEERIYWYQAGVARESDKNPDHILCFMNMTPVGEWDGSFRLEEVRPKEGN